MERRILEKLYYSDIYIYNHWISLLDSILLDILDMIIIVIYIYIIIRYIMHSIYWYSSQCRVWNVGVQVLFYALDQSIGQPIGSNRRATLWVKGSAIYIHLPEWFMMVCDGYIFGLYIWRHEWFMMVYDGLYIWRHGDIYIYISCISTLKVSH